MTPQRDPTAAPSPSPSVESGNPCPSVIQTPPPGYKQTEVGVIPEDWRIERLQSLCFSIRDGTHYTPKYVDSGVPFYSVENVTADNFTDTKFITLEEHRKLIRRCKPERGDILLTRIGSLGDTKLIDWDVEASIYVSLALLKPNDAVYGSYLYAYSKSPMFVQSVEQRSLLNAAPKKTNMGNIGDIPIPLPPLPEQRAIAEVLSDVDALLASLERLIAKKRAIKQGAMQQLLTGKIRLPGFTGEWEMKRLDEVAEVRNGGTPSTSQPEFWDGDVMWCTPTDITALEGSKYLSQTARRITAQGLNASSAELIPPNSVIMTSRATIGACAINTVPIATNQGFKSFIPSHDTDNEFLYYLLQTKKQEFMGLCSGSTFLEISKAKLVAFMVELPRKKAEQRAIAEVLSDMDAEIAALEARREKTRAIKQGMMQELLTGRIRLIENG